MAGSWVSFSLDLAHAARITWSIGDIVECQHVDYEGKHQGHSVGLVDSAAQNDGFNVNLIRIQDPPCASGSTGPEWTRQPWYPCSCFESFHGPRQHVR